VTATSEALHLHSSELARPAVVGFGLTAVYTLWIFILFEPQWFIPSLVGGGGGLLQRGALLLLLPALIIATQYRGLRAFYWPLALFALIHLINVPPAMNRGLALVGFKDMFRILALVAATLTVFDTPDRILQLLKLLLLSFAWYLVQGIPGGTVDWHTEMANPDAFGGMSVTALGFGYYLGMSTRIPRWRYLGFAVSALGLVGVVASFARGALLAAALVLVLVWIRSPRKMATLLGGVVAAGVLFATVAVIYPQGEFWSEMATITEGAEGGTGADRWALWQIGWMVFQAHPVFGAGAHCVGVVGAEIVPAGMFEGMRYANPETLYNRPLHNTFIQILSEEGAVGLGLWLFMLLDFWRRQRKLRRPAALAAWKRSAAGDFDLLHISLALEMAMVGFLGGAFFYNQTYRHWFFTLVVVVLVLSEVVTRAEDAETSHSEADGAARP
jgi:O-antigen ligase